MCLLKVKTLIAIATCAVFTPCLSPPGFTAETAVTVQQKGHPTYAIDQIRLRADGVFEDRSTFYSVVSLEAGQRILRRQQAISRAGHQLIRYILAQDHGINDQELKEQWPYAAKVGDSFLYHHGRVIPIAPNRIMLVVQRDSLNFENESEGGLLLKTLLNSRLPDPTHRQQRNVLGLAKRHQALVHAPPRKELTKEMVQTRAILNLRHGQPEQALKAYTYAQIALGNRFEAEQSLAILKALPRLPKNWQKLAGTTGLGNGLFENVIGQYNKADRTSIHGVNPTITWSSLARTAFVRGRYEQALLASRRALALNKTKEAHCEDVLRIYSASCEQLGLSHSQNIIYVMLAP